MGTCLTTWSLELGELIGRSAETVDQWIGINRVTGVDAWVPDPDSPAFAEIEAYEVRADGSPWGGRPARTVYQYVQMVMKHTVEISKSVGTLIAQVQLAPSIEVLVRTSLESASTAWWLLDESLTVRQRVCRMQLLRRNNASYYAGAAVAMGIDISMLDMENVQTVEEYGRELGLGSFNSGGKSLEEESLPSYTARTRQFTSEVGLKGAYQIYSSTAHSELAGLWRMFRHGASNRVTHEPIYIPFYDQVLIHAAANVTITSVVIPITRIAKLFGWDQRDDWNSEFDNLIGLIGEGMQRCMPEQRL